MAREWDVNQAAMPDMDVDATPDFRWVYFSSLAVNGMAAATRAMYAERRWLKAKMALIEMADLKKAAVRDKARAEAKVRQNMSADSIKQHGGSTAKERVEYVERIVAGAAEVLGCAAALAEVERKIADLELAAEKAEKTGGRQDRVIRFFEHILDTLSTFAPESAGGAAALTGQVPPWEAPGVPPSVIQDDGAGGESPHLPNSGRFIGGTDGPDLSEGPPAGFVEDTELPF